LLLGIGHVYLSEGASSVLVAGELKLFNGTIREYTNSSGHYLPSIKEAQEGIDILTSMGADFSNARVTIYHENGKIYSTYKNKNNDKK